MVENSQDQVRSQVLKEFGTRVRTYGEKRKLNQEKLAEKAGLYWTFVGQVERGERNLSLVNVLKLAKALKVDTGYSSG